MADRADLKELTLKKLKELAKKLVGEGYTKLKTKAEIVGALKKVPQTRFASKASKASKSIKANSTKASPAKKVQPAAKSPVRKSSARRAEGDISEETPTVGGRARALRARSRVGAKAAPKTPAKARAKTKAVEKVPQRVRSASAASSPAESEARRYGPAQVVRFDPRPKRNGIAAHRAAEPLVEGFFVARVAGALEALNHHLVEENAPFRFQPPEDPERLGELPWSYGSDAEVALPRDPRTLFFFWDFSSDTLRASAEGLHDPRAVLVLFEEGRVVREVDFALESRSYYLHDLKPMHTYRVEAYFVGSDGRRRRIGRGSNWVTLPPEGPSSDTSVRFMRVPWGQPLHRRGEASSGGVERRYLTWERVALPNSYGFVNRLRERIERDEGVSQVPELRTYLGSSFTGLGSSEHLGASERWAYRPASEVRGERP